MIATAFVLPAALYDAYTTANRHFENCTKYVATLIAFSYVGALDPLLAV